MSRGFCKLCGAKMFLTAHGWRDLFGHTFGHRGHNHSVSER